MKLEPPKLEANSIQESIANARKIVRWGGENLVEVHRAMAFGAHNGLQMEESLQLLAATLILLNCEYWNLLLKFERTKSFSVPLHMEGQ